MDMYKREVKAIELFSKEICSKLLDKYISTSKLDLQDLNKTASEKWATVISVNPAIAVEPHFYHEMYSKINMQDKGKSIDNIYIVNTGELMYRHEYTAYGDKYEKYIPIYPAANFDNLSNINNRDYYSTNFCLPCLVYGKSMMRFYNNWKEANAEIENGVCYKPAIMLRESYNEPTVDNAVYVLKNSTSGKFPYTYIGSLSPYSDYIIIDPWSTKNFIKDCITNSNFDLHKADLSIYYIGLTPEEYSAAVPDRISEKYIGINFKYNKSKKHNDAVDSLAYCIDNYGEKTIKEAAKKSANYAYAFRLIPDIDCVMYNNPFTVIHWSDNTKTTVKVMESETYDPEKGFAMAVLKKLYGNNDDYYDNIRKYLPDSK